MDKLSEHAIKMLKIVDNERGFYKDMDGEVADIARAVYDLILQVQMLKMAERKIETKRERYCTNCKNNGVLSVPMCDECHDMSKHEYIEPQTENCSENQNSCETCRFYHPDYEAIACERCLDGKYSRYEPRCIHTDCYYYDHFDADVCGRCTSKDEQTERESE